MINEELIKRIDDILFDRGYKGRETPVSTDELVAIRAALSQPQAEIKRLTLALKDSQALNLKFAQDREAADAEIERLSKPVRYVSMTDEDIRKLFAMNLHNLSPEVMIQTIEEIVIRRVEHGILESKGK